MRISLCPYANAKILDPALYHRKPKSRELPSYYTVLLQGADRVVYTCGSLVRFCSSLSSTKNRFALFKSHVNSWLIKSGSVVFSCVTFFSADTTSTISVSSSILKLIASLSNEHSVVIYSETTHNLPTVVSARPAPVACFYNTQDAYPRMRSAVCVWCVYKLGIWKQVKYGN